MENTNIGDSAGTLKFCGAASIWVPVIEIGFGRQLIVARSIWHELENGTFERQQWIENLSCAIELSAAFKRLATAAAARIVIERLRPAFRREFGTMSAIVYDRMIWRRLLDYKRDEESQPARKIFYINAAPPRVETIELISSRAM